MNWIEELKQRTGAVKMATVEKSNDIFTNFMKVVYSQGYYVVVQVDNKLHMVEESFFKKSFGMQNELLEKSSKIIVDQHTGKVIKNTINNITNMLFID